MADAAPSGGDETIGLDFVALREDGIGMLQRLCGQLWTDYNVHDPGVTALELLAYSLSDLAFRTDFAMADYLTAPDGSIDYERHALYHPAAIFSCEALTINDYRRLLYDAIPGVAEIWVRQAGRGLLAIDIMAQPEGIPDAIAGQGLTAQVHQVFAAHRSLGEDLASVRLIAPRPYYLCGEVDTYGQRDVAEILAQILFDCGDYISSGMAVQRLRDVVQHGAAPDDVFEGPAMRHGYVSASEAGARGRRVTVSELIGVIQKIDGVRRVRTLVLLGANGQPCKELMCESADGDYPSFPFPLGQERIELLRLQPEQGIEYGVSEQMLPSAPAWRARNRAVYEEALLEFHKLHFERHAFRTEPASSASCYPLPTGRHRDLAAYYSIQNEFPEVYGINQYGLPSDASAERVAQARQLKAYLFPFEQLMANFLQNLQQLPTLFSAGEHQVPSTYHWQALGGRQIAQIEPLYALTPDVRMQALQSALARQDDYTERKGRLYDYLLALYGEAFPQTTLRRFTHYHGADIEAWLLEAKRRLIVALVELGAGRGRAYNYLAATQQGAWLSPLQRRAAILLGFDDQHATLMPVWRGAALTLSEGSATPDRHQQPPVPALMPLPPAQPTQVPTARLLVPLDGCDETMFADGALLSNYRLVQTGSGASLYCRSASGWMAMGEYASTGDAISAAHASVASLVTLNRQCEGMHLIEHVLLRPRQDEVGGVGGAAVPAAFFEARISLVLPRWTLRCADSDFRNFVEETVREHCPAHLHASFLWLAPALMAQFEDLQTHWRTALSQTHADGSSLQQTALALVSFLRQHKADPA